MSDFLHDTVSYALARAAMAHRASAFALLNDVGLHPGQEFLLRLLWLDDGRTMSQLAAEMGVEAPTVTKSVRRLERVGFVTRAPDEQDRRVVRIWLTDAGRALEARVREQLADLEARTTASLDEAEARQLRDLLLRVRDGLLDGRHC